MGRKPRIELAGGIFHVYARGNNRKLLFIDDDDRRRYLTLLDDAVQECMWRCHAYCLMSNHVHLILETPQPNLGDGMRIFHGAYARSLNARHQHINHVFGDRYGSSLLRDDNHYRSVTAYVALNPVKADLCEAPPDFPWSSTAAILGLTPQPRWLDVGAVLDRLGRRTGYCRLLEDTVKGARHP